MLEDHDMVDREINKGKIKIKGAKLKCKGFSNEDNQE